MRKRRAVVVFISGAISLVFLGVAVSTSVQQAVERNVSLSSGSAQAPPLSPQAQYEASRTILSELEVKGRAPKTGYERAEFGRGWAKIQGCSTRDIILYRDLTQVTLEGECKVMRGTLKDPYTGESISFTRERSDEIQIDHVVALSDAWQKGAQLLTKEQRQQLANDPLELLAVQGKANQAKADSDAASWLPKNKAFRCEYVARQIAVKKKYQLWVTQAEKEAMTSVLVQC